MPAFSTSAKEIFLAALEAAKEDRAALLDGACGDDSALRRQVEALLRAHDEPDSLLDRPRIEVGLGDASSLLPADGDYGPTVSERRVTEGPGTVIGPYKLLEQIGEGGFGVVFMAEQTAPVKRKVALKVIKPGMDTRQVIARFEAERQALALMDHPHIAKVLDAGATDTGRPFFVMELVKGVPITEYCDQHHLAPRERLELFVTVCQAVQHAHQKGIIHRDIKPSNVLVTLSDDKPVVKVIDFGIAKATSGQLTDKTLFTGVAQLIGTPLYMSPEQASLSAIDVDTRSDIYSLGVLLYELLTGTTPLDKSRLQAAAFEEVRRIIREEEPQKPSTRLSSLGGTLPSVSAVRKMEPRRLSQLMRGDLDWIVMKSLEKERARRYETANGFAADVLHYLADEPVTACPPSAGYRFRKFARRNRAALVTGSLLTTMLVAAVVVLGVSNVLIRKERNAKDKALTEKVQALGEKDFALNEKQSALVEKQAALTQSQKNLDEAERQEGIAREQQEIAKEQTALAERRLYASQMNLAMQAWRAGETPRVLELLEGQRPGANDEDLRGFEWYYLWRLCNSGRRLYLYSHTDTVMSVAFSPDGATLASASWDGTVRLWDTATGRERMVLRGDSSEIWEVEFSPDGRTLASNGRNPGSLTLWDVGTGQPLCRIAGAIAGLAFSRDGSVVAAGLATESGIHATLWDVASGGELAKITDAGAVVGYLADGTTLVTAVNQYHSGGEVRFWNLETGIRLRAVPVYFSAAILTPEATRIATLGERGVEFFGVENVESVERLFVSAGMHPPIAFSPDGKLLAGGIGNRSAAVYEIESGRQLATEAHLDPLQCVAFSPDGRMLASSTLAGRVIKLWDMTPPEETTTIAGVSGVTSLRFDSSGRTLLVGHSGPTKIVDVAAGREAAVLPPSGIRTISADAGMLAGPGIPEQGALWDVDAGQAIAGFPLPQPTDIPPGLALSPDGNLVASYYPWRGDQSVKLWDVARQELRTLMPDSNSLSVNCAEFSPDGTLLAAGFQFCLVCVWDVATGEVKLQFSQGPSMMVVYAVAFSPNNKALAVGAVDGTVTLWDVDSGRQLAAFKGHASVVNALAFSPDGRTLATGGADKTVRLWDVATGQERSTLTGHEGQVLEIQFSPDGYTLATAGSDGTVKLWRAATDPEAVARRTSVVDPNAQVAAQFGSSARRFARSGNPFERDAAKAVELAEKAIALDPDEPTHWTSLAIAHAYAGEWQAAADSHQQAIELDPYCTEPHINFGNALLDMEKFDEAIACYQKAIDIQPREALAHFNIGIALDRQGRLTPDESIAHSRQTLELDPTYAPAHTRLGYILVEQKQLDEAVACHLRAIELDPNDSDAHYYLGVARTHQQELDEAIPCFRRSIELSPQDADAHFQLGWVLSLQEKWDESLVWLRKCLVLDPNYLNAHWVVAMCLDAQGQHDEAIASWRKVIEIDPKHGVAYVAIGNTLTSQGMLEQAVASYQDAIRINPGYARSYLGLGNALFRQGKHAEAIAACRRAVDLDPNLGDAHNGLAWYLANCADPQLRDPAEAVRLAGQAVALAPDKWHIHHTLGVAHYRVGDFQASLVALGKSMELRDGGDSIDWFFLAMAHWQLGDEAEARLWYDRAVQWMDVNRPDEEDLLGFRAEAAALLDLPPPPAPTLALPPGAINKATQIAELLLRRAALDERAAAASTDRWERWQLATDYYQLAVALKDLEQFPEAEAVCRQALGSFHTLADEDPHEIQFDYDIGWAAHLVADVLMRSGRFEEAAPLLRDALAHFRTAAAIQPDRPEYCDAIQIASGLLAGVLEQLNSPEEAEQAQRESQEAAQDAAELRRTLPSPQELMDSARAFAETRDWQQAAAVLNRGFERQPRSDMSLCFSTGLAQLLAGDVEGYARLAESLPVPASSKWSRWSRLDVLRTCTIHPRGAANPATLLPLANAAYEEEVHNWSAQNLGMAHYRIGEFEEALRRMKEAQELCEWFLFYPALAMTHHQLGHADEARQWLDKANTSFLHFVPPRGERLKTLPDDPYWQDWAYFEVMLIEARALMGESEALPPALEQGAASDSAPAPDN